MSAAFLAPGEALVDAIAVGLVGDDEDAAVGGKRPRRRGGTRRPEMHACAEENRMDHTGEEGTALKNRPKVLIMINHGPVGVARIGQVRRPDRPQIGHKQGLDAVP